MKKIYLLGVGRNTPVCMDLAIRCGYEVAGLYHYNDERTGESDHGILILGSFADLFARDSLQGLNFLLTMGDSRIRVEVADRLRKLGANLPSLIHPAAVVSGFATIEDGVTVNAFSNIQADVYIGQDSLILSGVNVSHGCVLDKGCFIAGGATVGALTKVGACAFIGQGALILSSKVDSIGEYAVIGAGALVTKPVAPHDVVAGRPAKSIKSTV